MMKTEFIDPKAIQIPDRLRAVDPKKVDALAQSMEAIGLQQPVHVYSVGEYDCALIAGAHRVHAAIKLNWEKIECVSRDDWSDIDRQLWEIDENLMRAELTATQLTEHLAKRKELWEARQIQVAQVDPPEIGYGKPPPQKAGFAAETEAATGVSKSTTNRALARAEVPQDIRDLIRGTKLDTGAYLDRLKGMSREAQHEQVAEDLERLSNEKRPAKKAAVSQVDADEKQLKALQNAWNKASSEARRQFDEWRQELDSEECAA